MIVKNVEYSSAFKHQFNRLPKTIRGRSASTIKMLKENAFYPALRLHKLKGKLKGAWSVSVGKSYRIIFVLEGDGKILLTSIGTHGIYED